MKKVELSIVIPCLNERKTIRRSIIDAKKHINKHFPRSGEVIVADNGSEDGSQIIAKKAGARLITVPVRGYGAALHWGIMNAKGEYVLFADADLSYPFSNLDRFVPLLQKKPDLILGSRLKGTIAKDAMPFMHRYFGTPILTILIRLFYGIETSDCNSGMRIVRKNFYKKLNMRNSGMEWASELLLKTALHKGIYLETPIRFLKDKRGKPPHLSTWSDGWRHLKAIFLLKPSIMYPLLPAFLLSAYIVYPYSFSATFLLLDLALILFLSLITLHLLQSVIEKNESKLTRFIKSFELVPIIWIAMLGVISTLVFVPDSRLGTKLFLVNILGILFMWIFLIETIKTHLANRLPDL